jgi:hypothetical protein
MSPGTVFDPGAAIGVSRRALRLLPAAEAGVEPLRVAVLAPPWIPVPPPAYGGIEAVVDLWLRAVTT